MKNNKGFTLVELLAMLVVLGILIGISVPNITGILNQQRETAFIEEKDRNNYLKLFDNEEKGF